MTLLELEQKLNRQKARIGLVGGRLVLREVADAQEPLAAQISPSDWHIDITVQEGYNPVRDKATQRYTEKRNIQNPLERICEDLVYHETGHWELPRGTGNGCPYDETFHDAIVESVATVLKKFGKESLAKYVANAFEDVLDNTNCRQHTTHAGQVLFWNEQGMSHGKYNKFYQAFVQLNLALWAEKIDADFLKRWYTKSREPGKAVKTVLAAWNIPGGKGKPALRELVATLYQKDNWRNIAAHFAEAMAPLLDEPQKHLLFGAASQAPGTPQGEKENNGSAFDKKLGTGEGEEKTAYARYQAGNSPATNRESFGQLDALYRKLAREIPVEVAAFTTVHTFPLAPYGRTPFDPEQHDLLTKKISFDVQEDGSPGLVVNKDWIPAEAGYKRNVRKFPKLRLAVLDTSSSMKHAPACDYSERSDDCPKAGNKTFIPWGDKSKYHFALLGFYGIETFLQRQHIAPYVDARAINFSASTQSAQGLDTHRLLLTPQFGGTVLDVKVLETQLGDGDTFLLSLSDGDIQNWVAIREGYKVLMQRCAAAHIQLGGKNQFSTDLESWGIPVHYVTAQDNLAHLMVQVASAKYKSYGGVRR